MLVPQPSCLGNEYGSLCAGSDVDTGKIGRHRDQGFPVAAQRAVRRFVHGLGHAVIVLAQEMDPSSIRNGGPLAREYCGLLRGAWLLFVPFLLCLLGSFIRHLLLTLVLLLFAAFVSHGVSPLLVQDIALP
jgi:hypothetical protein